MKKNNILILAGILIALIVFIMAADFTPQGEINLRGIYSIKDATNITSLLYCNATDCYALNQLFKGDYNSSFNQGLTDGLYIVNNNESNLNVNSSDFWDGVNLFNTTQIESLNRTLSVKESWFTTLWNTIFGTKDTDDLTEGTLNLYENQSFNETYSDTIYWPIASGSYNATYNSRINSVNSSLLIVNTSALSINTTANIQNLLNSTGIYSTFNATYDASVANNTFNESYANGLYWGIDLGSYNATYADNLANNTFNESYADALYWGIDLGSYNVTYVAINTTFNIQSLVNNSINSSNYWGDLDSFNATQMDDGNGITLTILESWFTTLWNVIFGTKDTDNLTEGTLNLYENQSFNETYAGTVFEFQLDNAAGLYAALSDVSVFLKSLADDSSPQLGGYLDANGNNIGSTSDEIENIYVGLDTRIYFGDAQETSIYYNGTALILG